MIRRSIAFAALAALAACNQASGAKQAANEQAAPAAPGTGAPAAAASPAATTLDFARMAEGTVLDTNRAVPCREIGSDAGEPWQLAKGVFVRFVKLEGAEVRVKQAGAECLVAADALVLSK